MLGAPEVSDSGDHADLGVSMSWFDGLNEEEVEENRAPVMDTRTILTDSK